MLSYTSEEEQLIVQFRETGQTRDQAAQSMLLTLQSTCDVNRRFGTEPEACARTFRMEVQLRAICVLGGP